MHDHKHILQAAAMMLLLNSHGAWAATSPMAGLPDPTRPDGSHGGRHHGAALVLQSTLVSGGRKSAVINGRLATIGSYIHGARVLEIRPDQVIVQRDARRITLHLQKKKIIHKAQDSKP